MSLGIPVTFPHAKGGWRCACSPAGMVITVEMIREDTMGAEPGNLLLADRNHHRALSRRLVYWDRRHFGKLETLWLLAKLKVWEHVPSRDCRVGKRSFARQRAAKSAISGVTPVLFAWRCSSYNFGCSLTLTGQLPRGTSTTDMNDDKPARCMPLFTLTAITHHFPVY
jgi:hypothetical protein